jgi:hypothetical protein
MNGKSPFGMGNLHSEWDFSMREWEILELMSIRLSRMFDVRRAVLTQ